MLPSSLFAVQRKALFRRHLQDAYNHLLASLYPNPLGKRNQVVYVASLRTSSSKLWGLLEFPYGIQGSSVCSAHPMEASLQTPSPQLGSSMKADTNRASSSVALSPVWTHTVSSQCKNVDCIKKFSETYRSIILIKDLHLCKTTYGAVFRTIGRPLENSGSSCISNAINS